MCSFDLFVFPCVKPKDARVCTQILITYAGSHGRIYFREYNYGTWGGWKRLTTNGDIQHDVIILDDAIPANSFKTIDVTFDTAFTKTPSITANLIINTTSMDVNKTGVHIASRTSTGFKLIIQNGGTNQIKPAIDWIAVGV